MKKDEKLTFEDAMNSLEEIVAELEKGELSLDQSVEKFKKGMEISNYCNDMLDSAEKSIKVLLKDQNGDIEEEPFEA
ncbi:MAG: exodeoxyribonuclease VII small subunit [Clostridia bacterium]|nr:exodeoxyribonuclease VII small subunit [Clostridia bacterium]